MVEEILNFPVSPYYLRKIRTFFKCKNQAVKGQMTRQDYELLADRYREAAQVSTIREKQMRRKVLKIWDDFFEETHRQLPITPEVFAKCCAVKGKEYLIRVCTQYGDVMFDLIDLNADGQVSPSEFRLFHKIYLLNDKTADATFKVLDKENKGMLDYDVFVKAMIDFFVPEGDEETPESVLFGPLVD